jgi:hypothetical protein
MARIDLRVKDWAHITKIFGSMDDGTPLGFVACIEDNPTRLGTLRILFHDLFLRTCGPKRLCGLSNKQLVASQAGHVCI